MLRKRNLQLSSSRALVYLRPGPLPFFKKQKRIPNIGHYPGVFAGVGKSLQAIVDPFEPWLVKTGIRVAGVSAEIRVYGERPAISRPIAGISAILRGDLPMVLRFVDNEHRVLVP